VITLTVSGSQVIENFENVSDWNISDDTILLENSSRYYISENMSGRWKFNYSTGEAKIFKEFDTALNFPYEEMFNISIWANAENFVKNETFYINFISGGPPWFECKSRFFNKSELNDENWANLTIDTLNYEDWQGTLDCSWSAIKKIEIVFLSENAASSSYYVYHNATASKLKNELLQVWNSSVLNYSGQNNGTIIEGDGCTTWIQMGDMANLIDDSQSTYAYFGPGQNECNYEIDFQYTLNFSFEFIAPMQEIRVCINRKQQESENLEYVDLYDFNTDTWDNAINWNEVENGEVCSDWYTTSEDYLYDSDKKGAVRFRSVTQETAHTTEDSDQYYEIWIEGKEFVNVSTPTVYLDDFNSQTPEADPAGDPVEFGNVTTTTCYVGGSNGIIQCTGNATFSSYFLTGGVQNWITPAYVSDIDDEDIESDLNTYVDIAGDVMTGNLEIQGNLNVTGCIRYNCSGGCITLGTCI
jgi:hypothetical protein